MTAAIAAVVASAAELHTNIVSLSLSLSQRDDERWIVEGGEKLSSLPSDYIKASKQLNCVECTLRVCVCAIAISEPGH